MAEREITRQKEAEARPKGSYATVMEDWALLRERARTGKVVQRGKELPWEQGKQGRSKYFLYPTIPETAVRDWMVFMQDIRTHSGRHRHQGGLAIYVLEGRGWTLVDGKRYDWEAGDLILLPVQPNGVEHQHFNSEPGSSCKWLALIFRPFMDHTGNQMEQIEE
ncbi:MAG: cupin domain-containing protein, partial [Dehalococcoidia bacterium]|nr:cupin domain-containing protein [Dehalococcoidia bacterium]